MKKFLITIMVFAVIFTLPLALYAQETDPAKVVTDHVAAFKTGDLDAALAYYADDAVYHLDFMDETYTGKDEIRAWWDDLATQNFDLEVEVLEVEGNAVTTHTKTWVDFTRELGIAPLEATEVYIVEDGKIKSGTWTPTEETIAKLQAAMTPETLPESGSTAFPTSTLVLTLGGLAILGGVGVALRRRHAR
jgi:LPXTG-motif cell wall-anchored protein